LFQALTLLLSLAAVAATPLDDYVWKDDGAYGWTDLGEAHTMRAELGKRSWTGYTLNMTSQYWLSDSDFSANSQSKSLWWHYLVVIVPDNLKYRQNATLWITGGDQGSGYPSKSDEDIYLAAALATSIGCVTGVLFQIPNQHITFAADPIQKSRSEDAVIAFTWAHFLDDTSRPDWLVRFPMVKASVKAMDAVTEFVAQKHPELNAQIESFIVSGASKRGWTTWLVGAVDSKRVKAIVPIVLDAINFIAVEHHEYRSYGGWSYALQDYVDQNLTLRFDDPNMIHLQEMEDPFFYKERLTMPKFVVNALMDEFQHPDDTNYWWAQMPEPKHFFIAPNTEHSYITGILAAVPSISAWAQNLLLQESIPKFHWSISANTGEIIATMDDTHLIHSATVWSAKSCGVNSFDGVNRRDWRVAHLDNPCSCGIYAEGYCANLKAFWSKKEINSTTVKGKRTFSAKFDAPADGTWIAFMIEFKFVNKHANPFESTELTGDFDFGGFPHNFGRFFDFTTQVSIWPNTFPYPDCAGEQCGNRLV